MLRQHVSESSHPVRTVYTYIIPAGPTPASHSKPHPLNSVVNQTTPTQLYTWNAPIVEVVSTAYAPAVQSSGSIDRRAIHQPCLTARTRRQGARWRKKKLRRRKLLRRWSTPANTGERTNFGRGQIARGEMGVVHCWCVCVCVCVCARVCACVCVRMHAHVLRKGGSKSQA